MIDFEKEFLTKYPSTNKHYLKRYFKLISRNYSMYEVFEKHHILPKSIWPEYVKTKQNLVKLPLRVHFIAHWILTRMLPDSKQMAISYYMMCNLFNKNKNSKIYSQRKLEAIEIIRNGDKTNLKLSHKLRKENQTHNLVGPTHNRKLLEENRHHFKGESNPMKIASKNRSHHWLGGEHQSKVAKKLVEEDRHPLQGKRNPIHAVVAKGEHIWQVNSWETNKSSEKSINTWKHAILSYNYFINNPSHGYRKIFKYIKSIDNNISLKSVYSITQKLKSGWNPNLDLEWLSFKEK